MMGNKEIKKERRKSLIINGPLEDLGDVLAIARVQGKIILGSERVRVLPFVEQFENGYVVVIETAGCSKASSVGSR
jgi:hypothetical protein